MKEIELQFGSVTVTFPSNDRVPFRHVIAIGGNRWMMVIWLWGFDRWAWYDNTEQSRGVEAVAESGVPARLFRSSEDAKRG